MRHLFFSLLAIALMSGAQARAQDYPVVVELFTSQGCSSCPPADEILTELAGRKDVIALALHVDYWDYLGWPDAFASAAFTNRQRAYARAAQKRTIYTPQVIVQGVSHAIGNRAADVLSAIRANSRMARAVDLNVERKGNQLVIELAAVGGSVGPAVIQVVRYMPEETVQIRGGENAGRKIVYSNIVSDWRSIARWNGNSKMRTTTRVTGNEPIVVLIQLENYGPIVAAAELR